MAITRLSLQSYNHTVMHYAADFAREKFDLESPYQRESVWGMERRVDLIRSLMMGLPTGIITINCRPDTSDVDRAPYSVIDGKQRIEAIRAFVDSEFAVPAEWFDARALNQVVSGPVLFWQLSEAGRRSFNNYGISTSEASVATVQEEAEIFRLINTGGVAQTEESLGRAASVEAGV